MRTKLVLLAGLALFAVVSMIYAVDSGTKETPQPIEARRWSTPQAIEMLHQPYVLLLVNLERAKQLVNDPDLQTWIPTSGNVMDDPQGMPRGCGVIGFRDGESKLRFLIETETGYVSNPEYIPTKSFYLVIWRSDKY